MRVTGGREGGRHGGHAEYAESDSTTLYLWRSLAPSAIETVARTRGQLVGQPSTRSESHGPLAAGARAPP